MYVVAAVGPQSDGSNTRRCQRDHDLQKNSAVTGDAGDANIQSKPEISSLSFPEKHVIESIWRRFFSSTLSFFGILMVFHWQGCS
jgi:hypothetical protein